MTDIPGYALLGRIQTPDDLRKLPAAQLPTLAVEMRRYLIETLGRIGGHFAANLGTVELSLALHVCFDTPHDRIVWDVGHQAYPHKNLSHRKGVGSGNSVVVTIELGGVRTIKKKTTYNQ